MMSHRKTRPQDIDMSEARLSPSLRSQNASSRSDEAGYALVALIALMTLVALFAMAAAPSIVQQSQREREKEAIFRGEEVADAIRLYYRARVRSGKSTPGDTALPTDIDQLLEGVTVLGKTKKLQILRPSAARDPLSSTGEWRLVKPHSSEMTDFVRAVMLYAGNVRPPTNDNDLKAVEMFMAPPVLNIGGLSTSTKSSGGGLSGSSTGPFIGVSCNNDHDSVLTYYGVDHHDGWVFTPLLR
jgi:type II secretory pathway pseudopilin PulG